MDGSEKFWVTVWFLVAVTVIAVAFFMYMGSLKSNEQYYRSQADCTSRGGSWIPTNNSNALCIAPGNAVKVN